MHRQYEIDVQLPARLVFVPRSPHSPLPSDLELPPPESEEIAALELTATIGAQPDTGWERRVTPYQVLDEDSAPGAISRSAFCHGQRRVLPKTWIS